MAHEYSAVKCSRCGKYTIQVLSHSIPIECVDKKLLLCPECRREILDLLQAEIVKRPSPVKFIRCVRAYTSFSERDYDVIEGAIYEVVEEKIDVMGDDPWISIRLPDGREISRPRYYFGPILN
jgi:hypothetical protein